MASGIPTINASGYGELFSFLCLIKMIIRYVNEAKIVGFQRLSAKKLTGLLYV
jgi:hypothetical protein